LLQNQEVIMIFGNKRRIVGLAIASCLLFTTEFQVLAADPQSETQIMEAISFEETSSFSSVWAEVPNMAGRAVNTQDWYGKALAYTDSDLGICDEPDGMVFARMYSNTIVTIVEEGPEWTQIMSGSVVGFVRNENLLQGSAAVERASVTCANGTRDAKTLEQIEEETKAAEVRLLAALIYCEAGNQSYTGKVAVGSVVMNRISSSRFPNTLEGVVYQRGQFTPARSGKLARVLASGNIPSSCYEAAREALEGAKPVGNALYFNTKRGSFKLGDHYFS
jgi:hypothetical protein